MPQTTRGDRVLRVIGILLLAFSVIGGLLYWATTRNDCRRWQQEYSQLAGLDESGLGELVETMAPGLRESLEADRPWLCSTPD